MLENSIIKKAERIVSCSSCQWDQFCVKPPTMTEDEVRAKIDEQSPKPETASEDRGSELMGSMLNMIFFAGKESTCPACPKFIEELKKDDALIRKIKTLMKEST